MGNCSSLSTNERYSSPQTGLLWSYDQQVSNLSRVHVQFFILFERFTEAHDLVHDLSSPRIAHRKRSYFMSKPLHSLHINSLTSVRCDGSGAKVGAYKALEALELKAKT
jgi:hypothetical protein